MTFNEWWTSSVCVAGADILIHTFLKICIMVVCVSLSTPRRYHAVFVNTSCLFIAPDSKAAAAAAAMMRIRSLLLCVHA